MTYGEFKQLDYPDGAPMEYVLSEEFYKGGINFFTAMTAYVSALDRERHKKNNLFNEAACVIAMWLGGALKKPKDKKHLHSRAIHILNLNKTFRSHMYDERYGYTEEDEKEMDSFCEFHYGKDINE